MTSRRSKLVAMLAAVAALAFTGLIIWAAARASLADGFRDLTDDPWGIVTLADVYIGLAVAAIVAWRLEPRRWAGPLWAFAILALGNAVTLAFIAYYLGFVRPARHAAPPAPPR